MRRGDRVEDEIKPVGEGVETLWLQRHDKVLRAEGGAHPALCVFDVLKRRSPPRPLKPPSLTAMWPNPPNPTTPTRCPGPTVENAGAASR